MSSARGSNAMTHNEISLNRHSQRTSPGGIDVHGSAEISPTLDGTADRLAAVFFFALPAIRPAKSPLLPLGGRPAPSVLFEFTYDCMSRQVGQTLYSGLTNNYYQITNNSSFLYDSDLFTNSHTRSLNPSETLQTASGIEVLVSVSSGGTTSVSSVFFSYDATGNTSDSVNIQFVSITSNYAYDTFRQPIVQTVPLAQNATFRLSATCTYDAISMHSRNGFFKTRVSSWLSRDPIGEMGGYNFYLAFNNNPISDYDALGLIVLKSLYGESTSLEELKELRSWLMSLPALPSLGDYQQALVNLQFWFNVDASRKGELEISEEWLKRQPAVVKALARLVQHFTTEKGDEKLAGKSGCEWAHEKLKSSAVGTMIDFPEGIMWEASVKPSPRDALYPAMGGFHFDGIGHFKIKKVDNKGTYEFIGSVDASFTDRYDWHEGLGILVPLWMVKELDDPATRALLGIEGDVPSTLNITDGAMLKLKAAGLGKDYDMKGKFEIKGSKQCCVP